MKPGQNQRRLASNFGLAGVGFACALTLLSLNPMPETLELALKTFAVAIPASIGSGFLALFVREFRHPLTQKAAPFFYYPLALIGYMGNFFGIRLIFQHMSPAAGQYLTNCVGVIVLVILFLDKFDEFITQNKI